MSNMTPWFPPDIKPVHKGVYLVKFNASQQQEMYATWNGRRWSAVSYAQKDVWHRRFIGAYQDKYWRGFTEEQK